MEATTLPIRGPSWLTVTAGLGVLWNVYGVYQFVGSFSQTRESLMATGMTAAQADVYLSLPIWISLVFAVGVFGGLIGSVALLMRKAVATPIFAASLAGYIALFAGDAWYGVFDNNTTQLAILSTVVVIAAVLFWLSWRAKGQHLLR